MRYFVTLTIALALCFLAQSLALRASGGRFTKSESNFFSSLGRIQAGTVGEPEVMLLGSSITGRLPDRAHGFAGFANMGCDGGSAVDALRAMDKGILPAAPVLIIEANTLVRALDGQPSEIGMAMTRPWFRVGSQMPALSAYARPSAFFYSILLAGKIGDFGEASNDRDLRAGSVPSLPSGEDGVVTEGQRRLIRELTPIIGSLREKGSRPILAWLPPGRGDDFPLPPWITTLAIESGMEWWDLGNDADPGLVSLTDGIHMSADSAARTVNSIRKGISESPMPGSGENE